MASAFTWYFLSVVTFASIFTTTFTIILFRQFIKKRTLGTILLTLCFLFVSFGEILSVIGQYIYVFKGENNHTGYLQLSFVFFYGIGYIFLYYFANRHILQDKDFLKAITTILSTTLVSVISTLMFSELIFNIEETIFSENMILIGPNVIQYVPAQIMGLIVYIPIFLIIHIRIVIKLITIRRDLDNPVTKAGFTFILYSVIFMVFSTFIASLYLLPGLSDIPVIVGIVHSLRALGIIISIIFGYFGWILPDWVKKRIRGKAWIVKQMDKEIIAKISPIATSNKASTNKTYIIEIAEE